MSGKRVAIMHNHQHFADAGKMVDLGFDCMIFNGEQLTDLMGPLNLGWRERREKELALMDKLVLLLKKRAAGRTISGLYAYEQ